MFVPEHMLKMEQYEMCGVFTARSDDGQTGGNPCHGSECADRAAGALRRVKLMNNLLIAVFFTSAVKEHQLHSSS